MKQAGMTFKAPFNSGVMGMTAGADGYLKLLAGIMLQGVNDYVSYFRQKVKGGHKNLHEFFSAKEWIYGNLAEAGYVFSFSSICSYVHIDKGKAREAIRERRREFLANRPMMKTQRRNHEPDKTKRPRSAAPARAQRLLLRRDKLVGDQGRPDQPPRTDRLV